MGRYDRTGKLSEKTTIYLSEPVKRSLRHLSVDQNRSLSEIIDTELELKLRRYRRRG